MKLRDHYKNNYRSLVKLATRIVVDNNKHVAEECIQQAYANLITYISAGNVIENDDFDGLLYRILFNEVHDANERELKRGMSGKRDKEIEYTSELSNDVSCDDEVVKATFERMCLGIVMNKWKKATSRTYNVLYKFFILGYSHANIASSLNISEKTSRNIVSMSLKRLK